jgi:sugar (pentulose or hexulose) kinase
MKKSYLLGIDIGTSALKCVVYNSAGQEVAISRGVPNLIRLKPGWSELNSDVLWQLIENLLREVMLHPAIADGKIEGIGITGTCCGSWLFDADVRPVRNAILWNDGRAADIIGQWQVNGVMDEIFRISGNVIFPGYTIPTLRWLVENEPASLEKARYNLYCKDLVRFKLTGRIALDRSDLGYMPFDIRNRELSDELMKICGIDSTRKLFPEIIESGDIAGYVLPEVAKAVGLPNGIPVVGGLVDVAATTLGAGAYLPGQACSIVGTSFLNNLVSDQPSFEPFGTGVQTQSVNHTWIRSMVNTSGTINLQWFLDQFCKDKQVTMSDEKLYDWAEQTAEEIPIGSGGIIYHPYLNSTGVVSPFVNPTARAQFFGISIEHTRAHMLRAVYEGTALSMLDCYANMPVDVKQLYLTGGGARSSFWCQMFADCTGRTILVTSGTELGARGVIILAGIACGVYKDLPDAIQSVIRVEREYHPDQKASEKYQEIYKLYKSIYQHVSGDWWERHNTFRNI